MKTLKEIFEFIGIAALCIFTYCSAILVVLLFNPIAWLAVVAIYFLSR